MNRKTLLVSLTVTIIIVLDQASKMLVVHALDEHEAIPIFESFFHLTHERNTGAAFSLLAEAPASFRQPFFFVTTIIAVAALLFFSEVFLKMLL